MSEAGMLKEVRDRWHFLQRYLQDPKSVGSVAPSSPALAAALSEPFRQRTTPARVLEVGAGTGAVTRHLGRLLSDEDELDLCEIQEDFARTIENEILTRTDFVRAVQSGRRACPVSRSPVVKG